MHGHLGNHAEHTIPRCQNRGHGGFALHPPARPSCGGLPLLHRACRRATRFPLSESDQKPSARRSRAISARPARPVAAVSCVPSPFLLRVGPARPPAAHSVSRVFAALPAAAVCCPIRRPRQARPVPSRDRYSLIWRRRPVVCWRPPCPEACDRRGLLLARSRIRDGGPRHLSWPRHERGCQVALHICHRRRDCSWSKVRSMLLRATRLTGPSTKVKP